MKPRREDRVGEREGIDEENKECNEYEAWEGIKCGGEREGMVEENKEYNEYEAWEGRQGGGERGNR